MDAKQLLTLAFQVAIVGTVFGFGLKSTPDDLLHLWRRPGLLLRSLLAVLAVMPVLAVLLVKRSIFVRPSRSFSLHSPSLRCRHLLYLLVSAVVGIPYVMWQRRPLVPAPSV